MMDHTLMAGREEASAKPWRAKLHEVIFEADTPAGRLFDIALMLLILASVAAVMIETLPTLTPEARRLLHYAEWAFTILFTIEYVLRLCAVRSPVRYATSFFGLVDLLAVLPTYLSLFFPGSQALLTIRALRLLRMFRVLKLSRYLGEADVLSSALRNSRRKIAVFLFTVLIIVMIMGSLMYFVEGPANGFTSIPIAMYWAIVTLTTVGYGDISPQTPLGMFIACILMITGYGIIAVPTGIVSVELADAYRRAGVSTQACPSCGRSGHDTDADFCKFCGTAL